MPFVRPPDVYLHMRDASVPEMTDGQPSRFFIIGSQRSGTTLMRLILECHTLIECFDEWSSYRLLSNRLEPSAQAKLAGLKVPQLTEQLAQPMLRDDAAIRAGTSGIANPYHGESLIFMVRDARDAVASMLNLKDWLPQFGDSVLEAKITGDAEFAERYSEEIRTAQTSAHPQVARAALIWRYKVDASINQHHLTR